VITEFVPVVSAYVYELHVGRANHDRRRTERRRETAGLASLPGLDRRQHDRRAQPRRRRDR
jgi:hypothetical protein